jgi:superfamily I DNA and/or RNA helicase
LLKELGSLPLTNNVSISYIIGGLSLKEYSELKKQFRSAIKDKKEFEALDINTIDGFQGREKDIILFSCVRAHPGTSNALSAHTNIEKKHIGFLSDIRRMNVGLTRAKYSCIIVGNSSSLSVNRNWDALIQDAKKRKKCIIYKIRYKAYSVKSL